MSLYVLDTDTLSLYERLHPSVCRHMATVPPNDRAITVITVEEQLSGWYAMLRQAKHPWTWLVLTNDSPIVFNC